MSYDCGGVSWEVCQNDDLDRSHVWGLGVPRTLFKQVFILRTEECDGPWVKNPSPNSDISNMEMMAGDLLVICYEDLDIKAISRKDLFFIIGQCSYSNKRCQQLHNKAWRLH